MPCFALNCLTVLMGLCKVPTNSLLVLTLAWGLTLSLCLSGVSSHLIAWLWVSLGLLSVLVASEAAMSWKPIPAAYITGAGLLTLLGNSLYGLVQVLQARRVPAKGDFAVLTAVIVYFFICGIRLILYCCSCCVVVGFRAALGKRHQQVFSEAQELEKEELSPPENSLEQVDQEAKGEEEERISKRTTAPSP